MNKVSIIKYYFNEKKPQIIKSLQIRFFLWLKDYHNSFWQLIIYKKKFEYKWWYNKMVRRQVVSKVVDNLRIDLFLFVLNIYLDSYIYKLKIYNKKSFFKKKI